MLAKVYTPCEFINHTRSRKHSHKLQKAVFPPFPTLPGVFTRRLLQLPQLPRVGPGPRIQGLVIIHVALLDQNNNLDTEIYLLREKNEHLGQEQSAQQILTEEFLK